ncbi:MAG TPA: DUF423 domain-containing protein [Micropepsaceae bacterium]|nr:DUF423 domain-containing protein [Micropepsaceae bacterium]
MNLWLLLGAISGFLAVAAGAFGAHALQSRVDANTLSIFQTAAHYHLVHSVAIVAAALAATQGRKAAAIAALLFTAGIVLFSGSLYYLVLARSNALVLLTPAGGLLFLAGWAALAFAAFS